MNKNPFGSGNDPTVDDLAKLFNMKPKKKLTPRQEAGLAFINLLKQFKKP